MSARQRFQNVLVSSPQELKSIPGYSPEIDLTQDKFVEILSHYTFRDEYQCALTGCHTWHKEGYVCVFESGAIGNVGRVCARNWIGSSFDEVLHRYQREIARPELLSKLAIAKADVPARLRQCDELRQAALDFITFKNSLRCAFPVVWRVLNAPQNGIAYQVMHSKTVTEIEEQEDGSIRSRSKIVSEKLGTIRGIRALRENVMELINSINRDLASIANSGGPQELTWGELNGLVNTVSSIDEKLTYLGALVRDGQSFLTPENESLIRWLQGSSDLEKEASRFSFALVEEAGVQHLKSILIPIMSKGRNRKARRQSKFENQSRLR